MDWTPHRLLDDPDHLHQQLETLAEINRRLIADSVVLRQKLDALMDQSAEQTIVQLRQTVANLTKANRALACQLEQEQNEHARTVARLEEEIRAHLALIAHQHTRLKEAFGAGLFGPPRTKD